MLAFHLAITFGAGVITLLSMHAAVCKRRRQRAARKNAGKYGLDYPEIRP